METELLDIQERFTSLGTNFLSSKEACDLLEDLKDMLTEKAPLISALQ